MYKIIFKTIVRKELIRILRIWPQTLLPSVITTGLYFLIFGNVIGNRLGLIQEVPYIAFIIPGLIMLGIVNNSYSNVSTSFFSLKFQKSIEEMLVAPMPSSILLLGFITGGVIRGLTIGLLIYIVSLMFYSMSLTHVGLGLIVALLAATLFSLAGFLNALYADSFDDISIFPSFVLTPLIYLGGVFYSVEMLPPIWQKITYLNPLYYLIILFRGSFLGIENDVMIKGLIFLLIITLAFWSLCLRLLQKGYGVKQ
jgi:ABC-2 type transport system permease protein